MFVKPRFTICWSATTPITKFGLITSFGISVRKAPRRWKKKVQAGFEVDLYAALDKCQVPPFDSEQALTVVNHFESLAREVESAAGNNCTV